MDTLASTEWDVVIAGTGLQESLLALALSRSGKRSLHVDKNNYYGGADAALSLQDAEQWAKDIGDDTSIFSSAKSITSTGNDGRDAASKLSFSRAYSLALSPQIVYTRSKLLSSLVSARVDAQLEFLAVGSWWVYSKNVTTTNDAESALSSLIRVPSGREDVVADPNTGPKAKRALMKFLRFISDFEEQKDIWEDSANIAFEEFLTAQFNLPISVQQPLLSLTFAPLPQSQITTSYALPRIARHLRSIGLFGPGFGAVIPKWGGLAELAQVGCRAGAVGGGVYVLDNGIEEILPGDTSNEGGSQATAVFQMKKLRLKSGDTVTTRWIIGSNDNIPHSTTQKHIPAATENICRSISIISSQLSSLFPPLAEGGPPPVVAVVAIPSSALGTIAINEESTQIFITIHSSDTGECPSGQSVLYASTSSPTDTGFELLDKAVAALLEAVHEDTNPAVLWKLQYRQQAERNSELDAGVHVVGNVATFPPPSLDLAFNDAVLESVKKVWEMVMEGGEGGFLQFPAREGEVVMEDDVE